MLPTASVLGKVAVGVIQKFAQVRQRDSGLCLCGRLPNFLNPDVKNGYKCVIGKEIRHGLDGLGDLCSFEPFQLIPYSHNEPATQFKQEETMTSCALSKKQKTLAKFPNITKNVELEWLDDSYVQFSVKDNILYFKWKQSVPSLQGAIITLHLLCVRRDEKHVSYCLRAKVFGTWPPESSSSQKTTKPTLPGASTTLLVTTKQTTERTVHSTQPSSQKTTKPTFPGASTTLQVTTKQKVTTEPTVHSTHPSLETSNFTLPGTVTSGATSKPTKA